MHTPMPLSKIEGWALPMHNGMSAAENTRAAGSPLPADSGAGLPPPPRRRLQATVAAQAVTLSTSPAARSITVRGLSVAPTSMQ